MSKSTKSRKPEKPKISKDEKEQVRARRAAGHHEALQFDEYGRQRLIHGTAESVRKYDLSKTGIVRVRNVDPLKGISSLTHKQREAGERYRADFELAAREGLKGASTDVRVDGGSIVQTVSARLIDNHAELAIARDALVYPEIVSVLNAVCGLGMSIKELATREHVVRDIPVQLLRMGLERLVVHYRSRPATRHG
ncbi:MAG: hypothetical protein BGN87_18375 [Rhizobiales bacterium 65-79]|nr:hypothetical protein [Hyphomicrobiales bacterium]OJU03571.1 MAG: hypothetical protein BGN87_18375 [Rhizobiales bacterium 65-79]